MSSEHKQKTHFGYQQVNWHEKAEHVKQVFDSVAPKYDLMNDVMSLGAHRVWKRYVLAKSRVRANQCVLDVAGGSGDLAYLLAKRVAPQGKVVLADINVAMLQQGQYKLINAGMVGNVQYIQANAELLPFASDYFHCITIAFGLRNVTDKLAALRSMYRVLKPGGQLLILEFSQPVLPLLQKLYDMYSFNIIPKLGQWITGDADSYRYLVESIRCHPDQEALLSLLRQAGFEDCQYTNLTAGVVALHQGYKY